MTDDNFFQNSLKYLEECKIVFAERFAAPFIIGTCCHIINLENRKREFYREHGRTSNLRTHVFFCAPPGHMKCVAPLSQIQMYDGSIKYAKDVLPGELILTLNEHFKVKAAPVAATCAIKADKLLRITTRTGKVIEVTPEHPFLLVSGWTRADVLKIGDRIATPNKLTCDSKPSWSRERIRLLAYLIAEGHLKHTPTFTSSDIEMVDEVREYVKEFDVVLKPMQQPISYYLSGELKGERNLLSEWLKELDLYGLLSADKFIPPEVFAQSDQLIREFLQVYASCEGTISRNSISICSTSATILDGLQTLLLRVGIWSVKDYSANEVRISSTMMDKFAAEIGFVGSKRHNIPKYIGYVRNSVIDTVPKEVWLEVEKNVNFTTWEDISSKTGYHGTRRKNKPAPSRRVIELFAQTLTDEKLHDLSISDVLWDEVKCIEERKGGNVIDLTINETHTFIANNIVIHNTLLLQKFLDGPMSIVGSSNLVETGFEGAMCVPAGQLIQLSSGQRTPIEKVRIGDFVQCVDDRWQMTKSEVIQTHQMKGNVLDIRLRSGRQLKVTDNHPLLTVHGWVEAGRLVKGSRVAIPRIIHSADIYADRDFAYLLGFMLADGHFAQTTFACADKDILQKVTKCVVSLGFSVKQTAHNPPIEYAILDRGSGNGPHRLRQMFNELGLLYATRDKKFIPDIVFTWDLRATSLFIRGLFDGDAYQSDKEITFSNISENLIRGAQHLLLREGIQSQIWYDGANECWKLRITDSKYIAMFYGKEIKSSKGNLDTIPKEIWPIIAKERDFENWHDLTIRSGWSLQQCRNRNGNISYDSFIKTIKILPNLQKYANVYWDEIVEIRNVGIMDVHNLSINNYHNFLVEDVITHNTEAGFTGTVKVVNGDPIEVKGAAFDHRNSILGVDEFAALTNAMKQEHSTNLDSAMLTALDSGYLVKRLALGKIEYLTDLTLFTGSQPSRFNLTSGLGRRFVFLYFIPSKAESVEIKMARREAKNHFPGTSTLCAIKNNLKKIIDTVPLIESIDVDKSIYDKLDRLDVPHFEEMLYERVAIGYTVAKQNGGDKKLHVYLDMDLADIFEKIYGWRMEIKKGAETSEVFAVIKEMDMCLLSDVKRRLTDFGLEYAQSTNLIELLQRQGRIQLITEEKRGQGRPGKIVHVREED